jgi:hypothetical protein
VTPTHAHNSESVWTEQLSMGRYTLHWHRAVHAPGPAVTNNQIAERLFISPKTVDTHRMHIMDKLNLHSRVKLVKYAMRRGLLEEY